MRDNKFTNKMRFITQRRIKTMVNRRLLTLSLVICLLGACAPSAQAIQTAIAETQAAWTPTPTSTFTPTFTQTPIPTQIPTPMPVVLYSDDFSNNQSGWQQSDSEGIKWMYSGGQYVLSDAWGWLWSCANRNFSNAVLTVDLINISGDTEKTGSLINWRYNKIDGQYTLRLTGDGYVTIEKVANTEWQKLYEKTDNTAINKGQQINHIAISFDGDTSVIYANDKYITTIKDSLFMSGDICLGAFSTDRNPVEVSYDNLIIYTIDSWTPPNP
jgi:hypothetical protein